MIRKLNILLAIVFAAMFAIKGAKSMKESRSRHSEASKFAAAGSGSVSRLAPNVYFVFFPGYTLENPITNRNGILLDIVRAIFPDSKFIGMSEEDMAELHGKLLADERAVVLGYGDNSVFKDVPRAPTPMAKCPIVLMTQRSNPWRYEGFDSLTKISIGAENGYLDYKVIRDLLELTAQCKANLRVVPYEELRELVVKGEVDAFVTADSPGSDDDLVIDPTSVRHMHSFRKSKHIGSTDYLFFVSGKDPDFALKAIDDYEAGMRRIAESGQLRRICEYYGTPYEPLHASDPETAETP